MKHPALKGFCTSDSSLSLQAWLYIGEVMIRVDKSHVPSGDKVYLPRLSHSILDVQFFTSTMRWPSWSSTSSNGEEKGPQQISWTESLNATDWTHYTDPRTVIPTILLTGTALLSARFYRSYLRRIPQATSIQPTFWRRRSLLGKVTSVGDGDNFRVYHTPGGRLAGWGWMPGRKVPQQSKELKDKTVC